MAFAPQLHPSAPLWSKELGGGGGGMGVRAPASLPGPPRHYPHCFGCAQCSAGRCGAGAGAGGEPSPSSSEESASPTEVCSYRRLGERAPLMRRLRGLAGGAGAAGAGAGAAGALLPSDDDSTPLVADTPTTPTNVSLCLNGGYINEAEEAEARSRDTRQSNREPPLPPPLPALPVLPATCAGQPAPPAVPSLPAMGTPRRQLPDPDSDTDFKKCNDFLNNCSGPGGACSRTASSSSGGSSLGAARGATNNNPPRAEPELAHAPWFQQGIPREIALEVLGARPAGAFLVRASSTQPACLALSVRVPRDYAPLGIAHYLILRTPKGYKIKGFTKEFSSLSALVTHHSVMPELLPVPLRLARGSGGAGGVAGGAGGGAGGEPRARRREHADLDALSPRPARAPPAPPARRSPPPSHHSTPRRAPPPSHHATPHRVANFLTQLDV